MDVACKDRLMLLKILLLDVRKHWLGRRFGLLFECERAVVVWVLVDLGEFSLAHVGRIQAAVLDIPWLFETGRTSGRET